jgi:hypothetical protein
MCYAIVCEFNENALLFYDKEVFESYKKEASLWLVSRSWLNANFLKDSLLGLIWNYGEYWMMPTLVYEEEYPREKMNILSAVGYFTEALLAVIIMYLISKLKI